MSRASYKIADPRIRDFAESCFSKGALWPEPLIQLNPTFKPGKTIEELTAEGLLHPVCSEIFRRDKTAGPGSGATLRLHAHQEEAIRKAKEGRNYILTTGTGSGKSLAYMVPIVDRVLRDGSGKGIRAIIVYPMNALANSQHGELEKFLHLGFPETKAQLPSSATPARRTMRPAIRSLPNPPTSC